MTKLKPKDDPYLFFFGSMVDLDCHLQDLKLVLKKTEEIDFDEHHGILLGTVTLYGM